MPPLSTKVRATAAVTGTVAANTAIGSPDATMLATATISSITNSKNVQSNGGRGPVLEVGRSRASRTRCVAAGRRSIWGVLAGEEMPVSCGVVAVMLAAPELGKIPAKTAR